jgi:hypothetical protein
MATAIVFRQVLAARKSVSLLHEKRGTGFERVARRLRKDVVSWNPLGLSWPGLASFGPLWPVRVALPRTSLHAFLTRR